MLRGFLRAFAKLHRLGLLMLAKKTYVIDEGLHIQYSSNLQERLFFAELITFVTCAEHKLCIIKNCLVNVPGQCNMCMSVKTAHLTHDVLSLGHPCFAAQPIRIHKNNTTKQCVNALLVRCMRTIWCQICDLVRLGHGSAQACHED